MFYSIVYEFLVHLWEVAWMLKVCNRGLFLSALHQFSVLIRVSFCYCNRETQHPRCIKNKGVYFSLMYQAPCEWSGLVGQPCSAWTLVPAKSLFLYTPGHCHHLMVEAGLLSYSGSNQ